MTTQHVLKGFLLSAAIGLCLSVPPAKAGAGAVVDATEADASAQLLAEAEQLFASLTPAQQDRLLGGSMAKGLSNTSWSKLVQDAIDPGSYQCSSTPLTYWVNEQVQPLGLGTLLLLQLTSALDLPTYDALVFGRESKSNRFGINGEYTHLLTSEMKDLKQFWDVHSSDIELIPMHGADVFSSVERIARAYEVGVGFSPAVAQSYAKIVYRMMQTKPALQSGNHPLFSFNAFAFSDPQNTTGLGIPDRIVMGDGILQGMAAVGLDSVAPRAILGHEFGHQVQHENSLFQSSLTGPEATRRTELMADAFATYFLTHARGEALNAKRTLPSQQSLYQVGDCSFSKNNHHGTPNQRLHASEWAADIANDAHKQGHILPSLVFAADFERKLPELVAPDTP